MKLITQNPEININTMSYYITVLIAIFFLLTNIANAQLKDNAVKTYEKDKYSLPTDEPLRPNSVEITPALIELNNRAVEKSMAGNYEGAIKDFRQVLSSVSGPLPQVSNSLAVALANNGEYDESVVILREVIRKNPDYAAAYSNLGDTLYRIGEIAESTQLYRRALSLTPQNVTIMLNLGTSLFDDKKYQEALKLFDEALLLDPDYAKSHNNRAVVLLTIGQNKEALRSLNRAVEIDPNFSDAYNNLGIVLSHLGKKKESHKAFQNAVELRPNWNQALYNLGLSCLENKDREDAYHVLTKLNLVDEKLALNLKEKLWEKFVRVVK